MSTLPSVFGVPTFCVVTGASRGLGRELALSLGALLGGNSLLAITARSLTDLEDTRKQLSACAPGLEVKLVEADLSDGGDVEKATGRLLDEVDSSKYQHAMMVHNAGSLGEMSFILDLKSGQETLQKYFALNVTSCMTLSSKFMKVFPKRDSLRRTVINISSLSAIQAMKSLSLYCTGKAARDIFFKTLAIEDPDIRVLNYAPGVVKTAMNHEIITSAGDPELRKMMAGLVSTPYQLTPDMTCKTLIKVLTEDSFESGAHIDYWDVEKAP